MAVLAPGLKLAGRYTLERRLGAGGMAEVWSALDAERGAHVAVKVLDARLAGTPGMLDLLRHEYESVSRLDHPNIVRALGLYADADPPFVVFELVDGGDLRRFAGSPPLEFLPRVLPVVDALAHAHAAGIVHRDLKLGNVLVNARGDARIADFGIAAAQSGEGLALRTGGTPAAMSPQQLDRAPATPADDIYALGVMLYELTTGAPPFAADATPEQIRGVTPAPIPVRAGVPAQLTELIAEMLAKDPRDRPSDMAAVAARLRQALAAAVTTVPPEIADIAGAGAAERFEQIEPLSPRVGRAHDRTEQKTGSPWAMRLRFAVGASVFLAVSALVFVLLPRSLPPEETPVAAAPPPSAKPAPLEVPGPAPFELAKLARAREEAQDLVDRIVELKENAESHGALVWAADEMAAATARAEAGDQTFKSQDYEAARKAYEEAAAAFEAIVGRADDVLAESVAAGWAAYEAHDSAGAIAQFQRALAIDSSNAEAARGLRRAERLDQVSALLAQGAARERDGSPPEALAAYREASSLDPEVAEAKTAIARITAQLGRAQFDAVMSEGFAALERGDAAAARSAFTRAQALDPGSTAASDALAQVDSRTRAGQFRKLEAQAASQEAAEQWAAAAETYEQVLETDPTLVFAQEGAARAKQMARLHKEIDGLLAAPDRLAADAVYESAQQLVQRAATLPGAELARKRTELEHQLAVARTPVHVVLQSDNATDVVLHQVDRLGTFTVRELELRPGSYTAVGTRAGYRDVRRSFKVVPGERPDPIVIACEERL